MKVPKEVSDQVKELVFEEADKVGYFALSRPDSGAFVDRLVANSKIGGVLLRYLLKERVRTYIKDAILNKYSKDKDKEARPSNMVPIIKQRIGLSVIPIDESNSNGVSLYRLSGSNTADYVIVANGTYLKWETALKKALLYSPGKPFASKGNCKIYVLLALFCGGKKINNADKEHLIKALEVCNATVYYYGES
jgi:hypothetical protein